MKRSVIAERSACHHVIKIPMSRPRMKRVRPEHARVVLFPPKKPRGKAVTGGRDLQIGFD